MAGLGAGPAARSQFGLLLRLHFLVLRRQATATEGRRLVTVLLVGLGGFASLLLAWAACASFWAGRHRLGVPPEQLDEGIHLVFAVVYGILVLSPALGFRGNEFLDVTRLFHLPVSHRTVFAAASAGISLSGPVLFWLPLLGGAVLGHMLPLRAGWSADWAGLDFGLLGARLLLVAAFVLHAVALGQCLVLALLDFLRSRRFQDLGFVLAPSLAGALYLAAGWAVSRAASGQAGREGALREILALEPSRWIPFLPSRWLTETLVGAGRGDPGAWVPFLAGFLPLTAILLVVAGRLQERAFLGEVPASDAGRDGPGRAIPGRALLARFFADPVLAVASKELRLLRREPIVKTVLIGQAFFLGLPILALALRSGGADDAYGGVARIAWLLPFVLVFVENTLTMNLLGLEGPGIAHLRTTPATWRQVLVGKDLCYLLFFGAANLLLTGAALLAIRLLRPALLPDPGSALLAAAAGGTASLAVVLAVGNAVSVALPTSLAVKGRMALRQQASFSEGCYEKLARIAVFAGALVLVAPIPLGLHVLPSVGWWIFQEAWWPLLAGVLSVLYAAALLRASLPLAARMAARGEELILERMTRSGE